MTREGPLGGSSAASHADELRVTVREAVPLATALVARELRAHDVPALAIKGPLAVADKVRADRVSMDVDIWIAPSCVDTAVAILTRLGWRARPNDPTDDVFPLHSRAMFHPEWPCDIDLHFAIPGLGGDPEASFAIVWSRSTVAVLCDVEVHVPRRSDAALIVALHSARSTAQTGARADMEAIAAHSSPEDLAALLSAAKELGAVATAWTSLQAVGVDGLPSTRPSVPRDWALLEATNHSASIRVIALLGAPLRHWPGMLRRALVPSADALASVDLTVTPESVNTTRRSRIRQAVRHWRAIVRDVRRFRSLTAPTQRRPR